MVSSIRKQGDDYVSARFQKHCMAREAGAYMDFVFTYRLTQIHGQ